MKFVKIKLVPYKIKVICDCGGEFMFVGDLGEDNDIVLMHMCHSCYKQKSFDKVYPSVIYKKE